jgi:uncharacterized protein
LVRALDDAPEVEEQPLFRAFLASGIVNANVSAIANLLRQKVSGWQRVGKPFEFRDAGVSPVLEFRQVDLVASVRIDPAMAREQGREIVAEEIEQLLSKAGVVYGIDPDLVGMLLRPNCAAGWYDVAVGEPAVDGADDSIECKVKADQGLPVPRQDGSVDFRDRGELPEVVEGTAIYVRIPGRPAKDGTDLFGKSLPARKGLEVQLPSGENMRVRENDPNVLEAACDGYLLLGRDGRVQVGREFVVRGDLDLSVGNIRYHGPVRIGGNVPTGFRISAGGDVFVQGTAEGSQIGSTGGSVEIKGGVFGGRIEASGDIHLAFAHEAVLVAGGTLDGGKYLQHCNSRCTALKFSRSGMIVGGRVLASREIDCDVLGTEAGTLTVVQLSDPEEEDARAELERISAEEKKILPLRDLLEQKVVVLKGRLGGGAHLLGRAREDAEETLRQYSAVTEKVKAMGERRAGAQAVLASDRARSGSISIHREIHVGVEVHIFGHRFEIEEVKAPVRLVAKDREIESAKI